MLTRDESVFPRPGGGESEAFAELYRRHAHELYDFAARITRDRAAAADVVQSSFATLWERARRGEQVRHPRAWLYRLARNAAIDELRRRGRTSGADGERGFDFSAVEDVHSRQPDRILIDKEVAELVWSTAAALRPEEYALLDLNVRRELPAAELAGELGITTGALYTRLSRLRDSFEDALTVRLLARRGSRDCEELGELVTALGEGVETEAGTRSLRAHVRACATCQASRRRYVTASEILASLAPVPLTPDAQAAIWSGLSHLPGLGAAGGGHVPPHAGARQAAQAGGGSTAGGGLGAGTLAAVAALAAVAVGAGAWAAASFLFSTPSGGVARDPARVWSPSHDPTEPSSENRIRIAWSRQPDAASYSVLWSAKPREEPDTVPDLPGDSTGTTSPALAPGGWYFHLRTESRRHGWTHTVHLGPFLIVARGASPPSSAPSAGGSPATTTRGDGQAPPASTAAGAEPTPPQAKDGGGRSSPGSGTAPFLPPARDSTPPSGQAVELVGGPYFRALAVPLALTPGVDRRSGVDPSSGAVQRSSSMLERGACVGWSTWSTVTLSGSTDATVADGRCYRYRYRVSDRAGSRAAFSRPSRAARVDTTPPAAPVLSLSADGPDTAVVGTTLFYRRGGGGGAFVVSAASDDTGSGIAALELPALSAGMEPTIATRRTAPPYEVVYTWESGAAEAGAKVVTAYDRAGNAAGSGFTVSADETPPEGASATAVGGPWFAVTSVPLSLAQGSDGGSGVDPASLVVERDRAPLTQGACAGYPGAWTAVPLSAGADATVQGGNCYRYRVGVSDRIGNRSTSPASGDVKVDTTPPSAPALVLSTRASGAYATGSTVYYRPGSGGSFSVEAAAADAESGIRRVVFPTLESAGGGGPDDTAAYEAVYSWPGSFDGSGMRSVTAWNEAGLGASSAFTLAADATAPSGTAVTPLAGPWYSAAAVPLAIAEGSDAGSGIQPGSLLVERDSAPLDGGVCGAYSGAWTVVSLSGGADTGVESGNCYRYRASVSDNVGNRSVSPASTEARIDVSPPAPLDLVLQTSSPGVYVSGATVFFGPASSGSLTVEARARDPQSGIERVDFPALAGAIGGGGLVTAPYEVHYGWMGSLAAAGAQTVRATNRCGLATDATFTLTADTTAPVGVSVTLLGGTSSNGGAVPLDVDEGQDAESGVDPGSLVVERDSAPLTAGVCGPFPGAWTVVLLHGGADTSVDGGNCYRYRASVSDNVGNRSTSPPSDAARVG